MIDIDRIRQACNLAKEKGWTIAPLVTLSHGTKCCCPIGAVAVAESMSFNEIELKNVLETITNRLGMTDFERRDFVAGFDQLDGITDWLAFTVGGLSKTFLIASQLRQEFCLISAKSRPFW